MTFFVEVAPQDVDGVPWREGCEACQLLQVDPSPGTGAWLSVVRSHMELDHDIWVMHTTEGHGPVG